MIVLEWRLRNGRQGSCSSRTCHDAPGRRRDCRCACGGFFHGRDPRSVPAADYAAAIRFARETAARIGADLRVYEQLDIFPIGGGKRNTADLRESASIARDVFPLRREMTRPATSAPAPGARAQGAKE